ncbi:MAG: hypothetical protein MR613_08010 [Prevotella sp.]|nr:hypothetical protein [Prevotella sp.]MCI7284966.1 hypothetical protein [Prevotella sp.]
MKKILTLMAAMSAVTGAVANDFDWSIPADFTTDASNNMVEGCNGLYFVDNTFSFNVDAGDEVQLTVNGKNLTVNVGGTDLNTELKDGKISFKATAGGQVTLKMGEQTAVTAIYVESDNYRKALEKIKTVGKGSVNEAVAKISDYSTKTDPNNMKDGKELSFEGFYTAIKTQINTEAAKVATLEAKLAERKANNTVSQEWLDELNVELNKIKENVNGIVTEASKAENKYNEVTQTLCVGLNERIKEARNTDTGTIYGVALLQNNRTKYIYELKANGYADVTKPKAEWCESELQNIEKDRDAIKNNAMELLSQFPTINWNATNYNAEYSTLKNQVDNMIARAIVERDYVKTNRFSDLSDNVTKLDDVLKAKDAKGQTIFTKPEGYDLWAEDVKEINDFVAKTDNRRLYTQAQLKTMLVDKCTSDETSFGQFKTIFVNQAVKALNELVKTAQDNIDTYSYKIAAKYQNEKETQKIFEKEFSKLQANLNGYKNTINERQYEEVVVGYTTIADKIEAINKAILGDPTTGEKGLWTNTLSAQKQEVLDNNAAAAKVLTDKIDAVRANYNTKVTDGIEKWKTADFADRDMVTYLEACQRALFDIVNKLDKAKDDINSNVKKLADVIDGVEDVEFDPNDNKYRFTGKNEADVDYSTIISGIETDINRQLDLAINKANDRAYQFFLNEAGTDETMTVNDANNIYNSLKESLNHGLNNSEMSTAAFNAFDKRYQGILDKANNNGVGENYLVDAKKKATEYYNAKTMADNIGKLTTDYLSKIQGAVAEVNTNLTAYTKLYEGVSSRKVKYTAAKAKEATYVNDYKAATGAEEDDAKEFVSSKLNEISGVISAFSSELESKALSASKLDGTKTFADFDKGYDMVTRYKAYQANEQALADANKLVANVEADITNLKAQIADYRDDAKAIGDAAIDKAQTVLDAQKKDIEDNYAELELGTTFPNTIKGVLEAVRADLKKAAEDAKKQQEGGNLDINGDGEIDGDDVMQKLDESKKTGDVNAFMDFVNRYLELIAE